jgi:type II secretory pathway component PulK
MNLARKKQLSLSGTTRSQEASLLIIVIWIVFGLVSITVYFAHSMSFEMRAADNRLAAIEAQQAIEGAARYIGCVLSNLDIPGSMPDLQTYQYQNVPVGNAHYWLIGRGLNDQDPQTMAHFGLVDECSKMNVNYASSNMFADMLSYMPSVTPDIIASIIAWRNTNTSLANGGAESATYMGLQPPYLCKNSKFETIDELRLIYNMNMTTLAGEDANLNGILDPNENDGDVLPPSDNKDSQLDPGILEYLTVYSREPTANTNGVTRYNITTYVNPSGTAALVKALTNGTSIAYARATTIASQAYRASGGNGPGAPTFNSPLQFYVLSGMSLAEIAQVEYNIRGTNVQGLVNVNTASTEVLSCIPGLDTGAAATLTQYRLQNTNILNGSIGWVTQALPASTIALAGPWLTGKTYQYTADIAAVGHNGRGYRRTRFVFDTTQGAPFIRYRQDLTYLGWALGKEARNPAMAAK